MVWSTWSTRLPQGVTMESWSGLIPSYPHPQIFSLWRLIRQKVQKDANQILHIEIACDFIIELELPRS
jgi:hypothetical protein